MPPKVCQVVNAHMLIRAGKGGGRRVFSQSAHWASPTSLTRSNLNIIQLFWRRLNRLTQGYNYVSQCMWGSQCALINSDGERVAAAGPVHQRTQWTSSFPSAATLQPPWNSQMRREHIIISKQLYNLSPKSFENSRGNLIRPYCENKWTLPPILKCAPAR